MDSKVDDLIFTQLLNYYEMREQGQLPSLFPAPSSGTTGDCESGALPSFLECNEQLMPSPTLAPLESERPSESTKSVPGDSASNPIDLS